MKDYVLEMRLSLPEGTQIKYLEHEIFQALHAAGVDSDDYEVQFHQDEFPVVWRVKDVDGNTPSPAQKGFFDTLRKRLGAASSFGESELHLAAKKLLKEVNDLVTSGQMTKQVMSPAIDAMKDCLDDLAFARKNKE